MPRPRSCCEEPAVGDARRRSANSSLPEEASFLSSSFREAVAGEAFLEVAASSVASARAAEREGRALGGSDEGASSSSSSSVLDLHFPSLGTASALGEVLFTNSSSLHSPEFCGAEEPLSLGAAPPLRLFACDGIHALEHPSSSDEAASSESASSLSFAASPSTDANGGAERPEATQEGFSRVDSSSGSSSSQTATLRAEAALSVVGINNHSATPDAACSRSDLSPPEDRNSLSTEAASAASTTRPSERGRLTDLSSGGWAARRAVDSEDSVTQQPGSPFDRYHTASSAEASSGAGNPQKSSCQGFAAGATRQQWKRLEGFTGTLPGERAAHSCEKVFDEYLVFFGGWDGSDPTGEVFLLHVPTSRWQLLKPDLEQDALFPCKEPSARNNHSSAAMGGEVFIHGGHDGNRWLDDFYVLDLSYLDPAAPAAGDGDLEEEAEFPASATNAHFGEGSAAAGRGTRSSRARVPAERNAVGASTSLGRAASSLGTQQFQSTARSQQQWMWGSSLPFQRAEHQGSSSSASHGGWALSASQGNQSQTAPLGGEGAGDAGSFPQPMRRAPRAAQERPHCQHPTQQQPGFGFAERQGRSSRNGEEGGGGGTATATRSVDLTMNFLSLVASGSSSINGSNNGTLSVEDYVPVSSSASVEGVASAFAQSSRRAAPAAAPARAQRASFDEGFSNSSPREDSSELGGAGGSVGRVEARSAEGRRLRSGRTKRREAFWRRPPVSGDIPAARACHSLSRVGSKLYLFGGFDGKSCFNDMHVLDLETLVWVMPRVMGTKPIGRNAHTMTVVDTRLFLFGGHSGSKHLNDLFIFDTQSLTWLRPRVEGSPPPGIRGHTATHICPHIFIFGGFDGRMRLNRVFFLNTQTLEWRPGPEPNQPASAAVVTSSEAEPAASGMLALSSTKPSRQNRIFVPRGRQRHSACCVGGGRILMFGGFDGAKWLNDVFVLNALVVLCSSGGREEVLHQRALLQGLGALLEKEALSDVSLVVQGEEIKAHRCILAANCPYFEVMFRTAMKESTAQRIQVQGASPAAVRALVRYLYTAHFAEDEEDILVEVLGLSDLYGITSLKAICERLLLRFLTPFTVCQLLQTAERHQAQLLKSSCVDFILQNPAEVVKLPQFEQLQAEPALVLQIARLSLSGAARR